MRLNDTTIITPQDWLVTVVYVNWAGREKTRTIGVRRMTTLEPLTEESAKAHALNSLRKRGQLPPVIKDVSARVRSRVGVEKTINKHAALMARFVKD